jgi:hypothetical protein
MQRRKNVKFTNVILLGYQFSLFDMAKLQRCSNRLNVIWTRWSVKVKSNTIVSNHV